jgi:hypothetical protein
MAYGLKEKIKLQQDSVQKLQHTARRMFFRKFNLIPE